MIYSMRLGSECSTSDVVADFFDASGCLACVIDYHPTNLPPDPMTAPLEVMNKKI
jgi:hypothetical protein